MPRLTLKTVNKAIAARWPGVELVKGEGYFYIAPTNYDSEIALKIAALYQQSINEYKLNGMSLEKWIEAVEFTLRDKYEYIESRRNPAI